MGDKISPQQITFADKDLEIIFQKSFPNNPHSSFINAHGYVQPGSYTEFAEAIEEFQVRDDDVWVFSFPKSGTTWVQEMVWCIANDMDFEGAKIPLDGRFPALEDSTMFQKEEIMHKNPGIKIRDYLLDSVGYIANKPSPRFIKSHLPTELHPRQLRNGDKKPKVIYIARNAKDTCISYYHFCVLMYGFEAGFEEFCTLFLKDAIFLGPYWKHVLGFWNKRNDYDMLFLKYEDMQKDLPSVIKRTATFLGKTLTNDQISSLSEHLSFSNMKNNPSVNWAERVTRLQQLQHVKREGEFMRRGTTEQWKTEMTPEMIKRFDDWIDVNLKDTGLEF